MKGKLIRKYFSINKKVYLTKEGLDDLKNRLDQLRKERFEICDRLRKMDPKEKAEYILANDEIKMLELNEAEVNKISNIIQNAVLVTKSSNPIDVRLGSTVSLRFGTEVIKYTLVSPIEADPFANKISGESPLGKTLLGRKVHEKFHVKTPKGTEKGYEVLSIA
ncbi:MAG: GreA/GreB family elongation factor [Thiobacillus sp.]